MYCVTKINFTTSESSNTCTYNTDAAVLPVLACTGRTVGNGISIGSDSIEIFSPFLVFNKNVFLCTKLLILYMP